MRYFDESREARLRRPKAIALAGALLMALAVMMVAPRSGYTHEPITTNVRFNKEVIRILDRHCLGCHSAGRIKADIPLSTYEEARPWAKAIKEEVLEKRMPPYQAVKGYGRFEHDYGLTQREIDLLVSWVEGGAPKGDEKDLPRREAENSWALGKPDLILQPEAETKVAADEKAVRCFTLPTNLNEDKWISGVDFQPGDGTVVHRAAMTIVPAAAAKTACDQKAMKLNGSAAESLGSWAPGQAPMKFPKGVARALPAGSVVVLKIDYRGAGAEANDRSAVGLYFATEDPALQLQGVTVAASTASVPAAAAAFRIQSAYVLPAAAEAVALRPLLFPYARSVEVKAHRPDGTVEVLVWAKHRRYDWEPPYLFKKPVQLPKGTRIEVTAYLDNSSDNPSNPHDPPQAVRFAEPLCELYLAAGASAKMARK